MDVDKKKKVKGDKSKKVKKEVVETPVVETVVVEKVVDSSVETVVEETVDSSTEEAKSTEMKMFTDMALLFDAYKTQTATFMKDTKQVVKKIEKAYAKLLKKTKKKRGNRSGFDKPLDISDPLAVFMGVEPGTQKSRNEVIKFIHNYIKDQELKNPDNKKQILPDKKLEDLLQSHGSTVEYFGNLQTFLKPHFLKKVEESATVTESVTV